jgi:hypothetical protein
LIQQEYEIVKDVIYIHKMDHRNGSAKKSQWTITEVEEGSCFGKAFVCQWSFPERNYNCWGLHFNEQRQVVYLGESKDEGSEKYNLFIAKFVDGNRNNKWHGYPANYIQNNQDIPPRDVLLKWGNSGYISFAAIRKIMGGIKCKI